MLRICLIGYALPNLYRQLEAYPNDLIILQTAIRKSIKVRQQGEDYHEGDREESQIDKVKSIGKGLDRMKWIEPHHLNMLTAILKPRTKSDLGFVDSNTVTRYITLLRTSMESKLASRADVEKTPESTLKQDMLDRMILMPAGQFTRLDERGRPVEIEISRPFFMDKFPVTQPLYQKVYEEVTNGNQTLPMGKDLPMTNISWTEACEFCNEMSRKCELDPVYFIDGEELKPDYGKNGYRLPTEAEWEYACKSNTAEDPYGELDSIAFYGKNSGGRVRTVGQKAPNAFGVYDILGNVWEWCNDWYDRTYPSGPIGDPKGPHKGIEKVIRGGSWSSFAVSVHSTYRGRSYPFSRKDNQGFRLVRPVESEFSLK